MGAEENEAVVRRYNAAINANDPAAALALVHPEAVYHYGERTVRGRDAYAQGNAAGRRTFPDWSVAIQALVAAGDLVATRSTVQATHLGPYDAGPLGVLAPTGTAVTFTQQSMFRVRDGQLVEVWVERDTLRLLRELGALPPAGGSAPPDSAQTASPAHDDASAPSSRPEVDPA